MVSQSVVDKMKAEIGYYNSYSRTWSAKPTLFMVLDREWSLRNKIFECRKANCKDHRYWIYMDEFGFPVYKMDTLRFFLDVTDNM